MQFMVVADISANIMVYEGYYNFIQYRQQAMA